jgi:hypothetical protein
MPCTSVFDAQDDAYKEAVNVGKAIDEVAA